MNISSEASAQQQQLTVLFCDLVDSTILAQELDEEEWREFVETYQQACIRVFGQFGGHIHEYAGDGPLVYFGYPVAYEDSVFRAVSAGLKITREFANFSFVCTDEFGRSQVKRPKVRVGIHTGQVITGDMRGRPTATGPMIALAERLQRLAPANGVVVSYDTFYIARSRFIAESLGFHLLKGFDQEVECFQIIKKSESYLSPTPFTARESELKKLSAMWEKAQRDGPQFIQIESDAGVGKSRLIYEFNKQIRERGGVSLRWTCSSFYKNSAFYPVIESLYAIIGSNSESSASNLNKLVETVAKDLPSYTLEKVTQVLHSLVHFNKEEQLSSESHSEQLRDRIVTIVLDWLEQKAKEKPLLLTIEDVHWVDPSTLYILEQLAVRKTAAKLLVVLTFRTERKIPSYKIPKVEVLNLQRLSPKESKNLLLNLSSSISLSDVEIEQIIAKSDGIPLFLEELYAVTNDSVVHEGPSHGNGQAPILQVPNSVKDYLAARIESAGAAKFILQSASVIGREFNLNILSAICRVEPGSLCTYINQLMNLGLILKSTAYQDGEHYHFKHAMLKEVAYNSLLRSKRWELHKRCATHLVQLKGQKHSIAAELLAYHFQEAKLLAEAVDYWLQAGQHAKRSFAHKEALGHFNTVTELLANSEEKDFIQQKLISFLSVGACYEVLYGYSSEQAKEAYLRAEEIANRVGDLECLRLARSGLAGYYLMSGAFQKAFSYGEDCLACAEAQFMATETVKPASEKAQRYKNISLAQSHFTLACTQFHLANFDKALTHFNKCLDFYSAANMTATKMRHDPIVMCHVYLAWLQWDRGRVEESFGLLERAVYLAREAGNPFTICIALAFKACIYYFDGQYLEALESANASIELSSNKGFAVWRAWALLIRGRVKVASQQDASQGLKELQQGVQLWTDSKAVVTRPFALALLAEASLERSDLATAQTVLVEAKATVENYGERYYFAEIKRLCALAQWQAQLQGQEVNDAFIEKDFLSALNFAREKGMHLRALKVSVDFARFYFKNKEYEKAQDLVRQGLDFIPQGSISSLMVEAKSLLCNFDRKGSLKRSFNNEIANKQNIEDQ